MAEQQGATKTAAIVALISLCAFVVIAWQWIPWSPVPAGAAWHVDARDVFTITQIESAERVSNASRGWSWTALAVQLIAATWLCRIAHARSWAEKFLPRWWWPARLAAGVLVLMVGLRVLTLPFAIGGWRLRRSAGLSTQNLLGYLRDQAVGTGVSVVSTVLVLVLIVAIARRLPRSWPAVAGGLLAVLVLIGSWAYPVLVEPLFNKFEPLPDGDLRSGVFAIAEREGVPIDDVLVADASRRTTTLNAYVSGFGSTRRVVLYDTLVDSLPRDQALSVVAHELAHAKHNDVLVGSMLGVAGVGIGVGALGLVVERGPRRRVAPGPAMVTRFASVPLLIGLTVWAGFLSSPVQNTLSRQIETRADVDALRATGTVDAFIGMQEQLAIRALSDPDPPAWSQWFFGSHPTVLQRIGIAEGMRAELESSASDAG